MSKEKLQILLLCFWEISTYGFINIDLNLLRNNKVYHHLGTKSLYANHPIATAHYPVPLEVDSISEGYEPIHIDALYRHGTRFPKKEKASKWKSTLAKIAVFDAKNQSVELLHNWRKFFPPQLSYALHSTGWKEMQMLAIQWSNLAGKLFEDIAEKYKNGSYGDFTFLVFSSPKARVVASADAFLSSLLCKFSDYAEADCPQFKQSKYVPEPFPEDVLKYEKVMTNVKRNYMRAFDDCERYVRYIEQNHSSHYEYHKFLRSESFQDIQEHISENFADTNVTRVDVIALFQLCTFFLVLYENDVICQLFNDDHMKTLEYASDVRHYYITGYGHSINYRLSCRLLLDVIRKLEDAKNSEKPSVVLRFGHAETLIPFLCLLGLYKDSVPLTSDNYEFHRNKRLFRTGTFSPFAGNIAIVLYEHSVEPRAPLKLAVVVNGHFIKLPTFDDCYLCDFHKVMAYFKAILAEFDCDSLCNRPIIHDEL